MVGLPSLEHPGRYKLDLPVIVTCAGPPPSVAITSHQLSLGSEGDLLSVTTRMTDNGKGVGRIEWRNNGVTVGATSKPPGQGPEYTVTRKLALDAGTNTIEVVAYNGGNLLASLPARTTVEFAGPADTMKPKLHILAIGINAYTDKGWTLQGSAPLAFAPLGLAAKDAQAFGASMRKAADGLYDEVNVTLALDKDARRNNLERIVDELAARIHPLDSFILFAAGHGTSEYGRFYLIPQDYQSGPGHLARYRYRFAGAVATSWSDMPEQAAALGRSICECVAPQAYSVWHTCGSRHRRNAGVSLAGGGKKWS